MLHFKFGHAPWKLDPGKPGKRPERRRNRPQVAQLTQRHVGSKCEGELDCSRPIQGFSCRPLQGCSRAARYRVAGHALQPNL